MVTFPPYRMVSVKRKLPIIHASSATATCSHTMYTANARAPTRCTCHAIIKNNIKLNFLGEGCLKKLPILYVDKKGRM